MSRPPRRHGDDLRGASRLAIEATRAIADLVETMHRTIAAGPAILGKPLARPAAALTKIAYAPVKRVAAAVGSSLDAALATLGPFLGESAPGPEREAILAALNGVLGDYLEETGNPLAIPLSLRRHDEAPAKSKIVLLIHGSSMNDGQWLRHGHDHGAALARDRGYTAIYAHYNSGRHVSTNGAELAEKLESLVESWPVPIEEIVVVAHSMGGLVARSACAAAERSAFGWRKTLRSILFLGTPHHGAALERQGNWIDTLLGVHPYSRPLARLGKIRSAGVTDLRFGLTADEEWKDTDRFALGSDPRTEAKLPDGVVCCAVAATLSKGPGERLRSDGLVPLDSALGIHANPQLHLEIAEENRQIVYACGHLDLLDRADVYRQILRWLDADRSRALAHT